MTHFEVFVLNYNGSPYLEECLDSLYSLERGDATFTINVVDNCSTDNSLDILGKLSIPFNLFLSKKNLGFSKGNNFGVRERLAQIKREGDKEPDVYVFLNNDTVVAKDWLIAVDEVFRANPEVGIVGSKSIFYSPYLVFSFSLVPDENVKETSLFLEMPLEGKNVFTSPPRVKMKNKPIAPVGPVSLEEDSLFFVPVCKPKEEAELVFVLRNPLLTGINVSIFLNTVNGKEKVCSVWLAPNDIRWLPFKFKPYNYSFLIQNAGSFVRANCDAGDRGYLEIDCGQYNCTEEVKAICGVSMFIRAELFNRLNGFDEMYFAYFEDTDLSLRSQIEGMKCVYTGNSVLFHHHCGGSGEFSEYFWKNVIQSQLIISSKFMREEKWKEKVAFYQSHYMREREQYKIDRTYSGKHYLRAFEFYLKHKKYFERNRLYHRKFNTSRLIEEETSNQGTNVNL